MLPLLTGNCRLVDVKRGSDRQEMDTCDGATIRLPEPRGDSGAEITTMRRVLLEAEMTVIRWCQSLCVCSSKVGRWGEKQSPGRAGTTTVTARSGSPPKRDGVARRCATSTSSRTLIGHPLVRMLTQFGREGK